MHHWLYPQALRRATAVLDTFPYGGCLTVLEVSERWLLLLRFRNWSFIVLGLRGRAMGVLLLPQSIKCVLIEVSIRSRSRGIANQLFVVVAPPVGPMFSLIFNRN